MRAGGRLPSAIRQKAKHVRRRASRFARIWFGLSGQLELELLRLRIATELPPGQARIARALVADSPGSAWSERPVSYSQVASALGISKSSVATQVGRIARRHPELWKGIADERSRRSSAWRNYSAL